MTKTKRHRTIAAELFDLRRQFVHLQESQTYMRRLLACTILKFGTLTLDMEFYQIPDDPTIWTWRDRDGQMVVSLENKQRTTAPAVRKQPVR